MRRSVFVFWSQRRAGSSQRVRGARTRWFATVAVKSRRVVVDVTPGEVIVAFVLFARYADHGAARDLS